MFEDLPALNLQNFQIYKIANIISGYIKKIKPDTVFIPSSIDIHQDHKIIFHAAKIALRPSEKISVKKVFSTRFYQKPSGMSIRNLLILTFMLN